ncbi:arginine/serine-rich protein 1 isoform X2 [Nelusetta ayraudi]|uniref:arginine/serine-rich protein 1 isoform X2 n=1 Tax=Nelusetta ayraudi TaxID=303726 RepID=UPI003F6F856F
MAKVKDLHSEMAHARKSDGIKVIFDQSSPASTRSRSRSNSSGNGSSPSSLSTRGRGCYRGRGKSNGRHRRSPSRRHKVRSHSDSCSPSPTRSSRHRNDRSRSRSSRRESRHRRAERPTERKVSPSPSRTAGSPAQSPQSSGSPASPSLEDKKELLQADKADAMEMLGSETLNLPESVKPLSPEQPRSTWELVEEPETRVRQGPKETPSQSDESDPEDTPSPTIAAQRKTISFSINNSVAKPTAAALSSARVTARVDSYESRKPYGHWVPVKSGRKRKHTLAVSR